MHSDVAAGRSIRAGGRKGFLVVWIRQQIASNVKVSAALGTLTVMKQH